MWSGRFDTAPDAAAFEFGASFRFDRRLFADDVTGSLAWARALARAGVLSREDARQIEEALTEILEQGLANPDFVAGADEDVHSFVERLLVERLGDAGRRLHTGRSRNEQVSLDLRLYLRRRIPALQKAVAALVEALSVQAATAGDSLMPSYTHFRPAQPVLVAHFFLAHVAPLRRDFERLAAARAEADALPLGSGAIAGTSYAIDVDALARDLGFSRVVANSIDASSDRDFAASFLYACALTMVHLSRLAEDLIIFCGDEHRFFELSDALSTGSSMMPQKKNPDPARARARKIGPLARPSRRAPHDDEGAAERVQQGPAGRQGGRVRRRRHPRRIAGGGPVGRRRPDAQSRTGGIGGIRLAAGHRCCGLPGRPGHAVPAGPRDSGRAGAKASSEKAASSNRCRSTSGGPPATCSTRTSSAA